MAEPRFALRQRGVFEVWDLAVTLLRHHVWAVLGLMIPGMLAMWLLGQWAALPGVTSDQRLFYALPLVILLPVIALSLVGAPLTAWLGEALLTQAPPALAVWRRLRRAMAPLMLLALWRLWPVALLPLFPAEVLAVFYLLALAWWGFDVLRHPWLVEIFILEGQGWRASRRRARALGGRIQSQAMAHQTLDFVVLSISLLLVVITVEEVRGWLYEGVLWSLFRPHSLHIADSWWPWLALWPAMALCVIVRYLSYINVRSASEGWELEAHLRLAAAPLEER